MTLAKIAPPAAQLGISAIGPPGDQLIDLSDLFGNRNPTEIEIGCGSGRFLWSLAESFPEWNFLGIDRVEKWMKRRVQRLGKKVTLKNLKFIKTDIRLFLEHLPVDSVQAFHIYFPDPWPKRRHRKRRLIQETFLHELHSKLVENGKIHLATDDKDYFGQMKRVTVLTADLWQLIRETENERLAYPELSTNYERKFRERGKTLYYLELSK